MKSCPIGLRPNTSKHHVFFKKVHFWRQLDRNVVRVIAIEQSAAALILKLKRVVAGLLPQRVVSYFVAGEVGCLSHDVCQERVVAVHAENHENSDVLIKLYQLKSPALLQLHRFSKISSRKLDIAKQSVCRDHFHSPFQLPNSSLWACFSSLTSLTSSNSHWIL